MPGVRILTRKSLVALLAKLRYVFCAEASGMAGSNRAIVLWIINSKNGQETKTVYHTVLSVKPESKRLKDAII
jgi:hypothetical protein